MPLWSVASLGSVFSTWPVLDREICSKMGGSSSRSNSRSTNILVVQRRARPATSDRRSRWCIVSIILFILISFVCGRRFLFGFGIWSVSNIKKCLAVWMVLWAETWWWGVATAVASWFNWIQVMTRCCAVSVRVVPYSRCSPGEPAGSPHVRSRRQGSFRPDHSERASSRPNQLKLESL